MYIPANLPCASLLPWSDAKELIERSHASDDTDISNRAKKVWDKFELWKY